MSGASVYDFRDLDLMIKLADSRGDGLVVGSQELAESMGLDDNARAVAIRCSWMARYGMLSFDDNARGWKLTRGGERVVEAKLRASSVRAIEALDDDQMVGVMAHVTSRYQHGDAMLAEMLRREFLFGTQRR
jgi:hypothetical protein